MADRFSNLDANQVIRASRPEVGQAGQGSVGTAAAQISSSEVELAVGVRIKNTHASQDLYVGFANTVTSSNGYKIPAGESEFIPIDDLSDIWLVASGASTTYCYVGS